MKQVLTQDDKDAEHRPCIRCGKWGETRNCHYNGFRSHSFGKGRATKGHRYAMAEFCQNCDTLFSEEGYPNWPGGSKAVERSEEFLYWCIMTQIRRLDGD